MGAARPQTMGLAFDEADLEYYTTLFRDDLRRDPTNVELFDIAQSNSEHSRHWRAAAPAPPSAGGERALACGG